jgi:hypothetical protein
MRTRVVPALALLASACESTEPKGGLFEPSPGSAPAEVQPPPDWQFPAAEPVTIRSEELAGGGTAVTGNPAEAPSAPAPAAAAPEASAPPESVAPEPAATAAAPAAAEPVPWAPDPAVAGTWPVRLVATVPDAQPPRAILGLADGREVVVTPGTLLSDPRLVVMAVGVRTVDLAQVQPSGDHADVTTRTLHAQR